MKAINLPDNRMAIFFPYHMVTEMTVAMACPRDIMKSGKQIRFAAETTQTAGTKRMDSEEIEKMFPIECAIVRQAGYELSKCILIELQ